LADRNAVCARDFFRLRRWSGWKRPPVSGGKIPFPKMTDASFRSAAQSIEWHFDIEIWKKAVVVTAIQDQV
jgi:hypothetical protein